MLVHAALYVSAIVLIAVGVIHSWLGERYILIRLFRRDDLPKLFGSTHFTKRVLRYAWHVTSVAWWGHAAILIALARPPATPRTIGLIIGCTYLVHFAIVLAGSRGKHLAWIAFLIAGLLAIYGTRA